MKFIVVYVENYMTSKNKDRYVKLLILFISGVILTYPLKTVLNLEKFNNYPDMVTFLSIISGFYLTSIALLFTSSIRSLLYKSDNKIYGTELHRLRYYFQDAFYFNILPIVMLIVLPSTVTVNIFIIHKYYLVLPIIFVNVYGLYRISDVLFHTFSLPS